MVRKIKKIVFAITLVSAVALNFPSTAWAQANEGSTSAELTGTRKQVATIIFAGLAGAILGLSTLSFYGRPQEHLSNIAIGFAVGVIGGATFTTYQAATVPYEAYDLGVHEPLRPLEYYAAIDSVAGAADQKEMAPSPAPLLKWSFQF